MRARLSALQQGTVTTDHKTGEEKGEKMRALCIVLAVLLVASVAAADDKVKLWETPVQTAGRALDCTNAIPINCGDILSGDNTGLPNNVDYYSCVG